MVDIRLMKSVRIWINKIVNRTIPSMFSTIINGTILILWPMCQSPCKDHDDNHNSGGSDKEDWFYKTV